MTQEEKQLLLKDLCARLPYKVNVHYQIDEETNTHKLHVSGDTVLKNYFDGTFILDGYKVYTSQIKPYLRPMSSMTEEELNECVIKSGIADIKCPTINTFQDRLQHCINWFIADTKEIDWLNMHHFDYRGLIEKGLALEAPEDMYD